MKRSVISTASLYLWLYVYYVVFLHKFGSNLEPIVEIGIFVGYTDTPHNYRVSFPSHRMTMVMRYVKFDEEKAMRISLEGEI